MISIAYDAKRESRRVDLHPMVLAFLIIHILDFLKKYRIVYVIAWRWVIAANRREFLLGVATLAANTSIPSLALATGLSDTQVASRKAAKGASPFLLEFDGGVLTSLRFAGDTFPTNYLAAGQKLGHVEITWRRPKGAWQKFQTAEATADPNASNTYRISDDHGEAFAATVHLDAQGKLLRWTIALRNTSPDEIEIGDLAMPLPMHSSFDAKEAPTASVLKHSFISGHGSFYSGCVPTASDHIWL